MKNAIKLALVGAALISGVASAATVNTMSNSSTGSSLVLLMKNYTDTEYFVLELSPTVTDVKSVASVMADAPSQYSQDGLSTTGALNAPAALNSFTNANLTAYLTAADNIGDNIQWSIMGSRTGNGTPQLGQGLMVFTSGLDHLANYWTSDQAFTSAVAMGQFIQGELNGPGETFPGGVSLTRGWDSANPIALFADVTFNGGGFENGASVGAAQYLYMVSTGLTSNPDEGYAANVYKSSATYTLAANGVLTYSGGGPTPEVPVPAAIWLLGSGLLGMLGVGRRRRDAVAA
jgi:hypothetical protein